MFFVCSCLGEKQEPDSVRAVGVFLLTAGEVPGSGSADQLKFIWYRFDASGKRDFLPENRTTLKLTDQSGETVELMSSGNVFVSQNGVSFQASDTLSLEVWSMDKDERIVQGSVVFPPQISMLSFSKDSISLADAVTSSTLIWSALDDTRYSYFLRLENLEDVKVPLNFSAGKFAERHTGPQINSTLVIQADDFQYYGRHKLSVFAIDRDFESFYFADPSDIRGLLIQGPSNLNGAMGFAAGMTQFSVEIELTD